MSIHERIKDARKRKELSMEQLAAEISTAEGLAKPLAWQTVQQWEAGKAAPRRSRLETVARLLGMSVGDLMGHTPGREIGSEDEEFQFVRRADVAFSNGTGSVVYHEDDHPPLVFRADFLRKIGIAQGEAVVVDAEGISNEPKIPAGSVVLVNKGDRERLDGDFFAFRANGELLIKRLERLDGAGIVATAENPNFKPKMRVYSNEDDFEVIGRAVWTGAML